MPRTYDSATTMGGAPVINRCAATPRVGGLAEALPKRQEPQPASNGPSDACGPTASLVQRPSARPGARDHATQPSSLQRMALVPHLRVQHPASIAIEVGGSRSGVEPLQPLANGGPGGSKNIQPPAQPWFGFPWWLGCCHWCPLKLLGRHPHTPRCSRSGTLRAAMQAQSAASQPPRKIGMNNGLTPTCAAAQDRQTQRRRTGNNASPLRDQNRANARSAKHRDARARQLHSYYPLAHPRGCRRNDGVTPSATQGGPGPL